MAKRNLIGLQRGPPSPLLRALGSLSEWLVASSVPGAVVGGIAASILGRPRLTEDIDVLVLVDHAAWPEFLVGGRKFGFVPRIDAALAFAEKSRVLLLSHQPTETQIDVLLGLLPLEEEIVHGATNVEIAGVTIPLPTPESIMVMKALAQRPRDFADIESILEAHDQLDLDWIRTWLAEFDQALNQADFLEEFDRIVARTRR